MLRVHIGLHAVGILQMLAIYRNEWFSTASSLHESLVDTTVIFDKKSLTKQRKTYE